MEIPALLGNYDRPTDRPTDRTGHREVSLQIGTYFYLSVKVWFKIAPYHSGGVDVVGVVPVEERVEEDPVVVVGQLVRVAVLLLVLNLNQRLVL